MKKLQFLIVLCCILTLAAAVMAQVQNGQFTGTITDPSGAAIPGATITVSNPSTNFSTSATTGSTGSYAVRDLPPATYKITVEAKGFKTVSAVSVVLNVGAIQRQDFKMTLGETREVIEVSGEAPAVNSEDSKLATVINSQQIDNLPLNGRNVYDLMQQAPGAVNVDGVLSENGHDTVVNGLRENFNGFLVNGSSNKGLSGGPVNTPIEDTVQEFQLLTLKNSAEYGNSAGALTNLVQKSGTNKLHGSAYEYIRNDALDANTFFNNQGGNKRPALRFNQFGGSIGGAIIKDKLFFFGAYQGDRFTTATLPSTAFVEGPEFRAAVQAALPNSVAALLYHDFPPAIQGTVVETVGSYLGGGNSGSGFTTQAEFEDPANYGDPAIATRMQALFAALPQGLDTPLLYQTTSIAQSHAQGNLFDGNELSFRLDWNATSKDRTFAQFNWARQNDTLPALSGLRGFTNPTRFITPNGQIDWVHTFGPHVVNEARAGYAGSYSKYIPSVPGVPSIYIGDGYGTMGFGSYNGYPQFFKENIYNYADTVSINHGSHNFKMGGEIRRNIENSDFNVARPSYYFYDPLYFAAGAPYGMVAGVDPGFTNASQAQLTSNVRHWRNLEFGGFFQDDWKMTKKLTLNLGIRYDLFRRHNEENNLATTFLLGPGTNLIDNITTGAGQIRDANAPFGAPGCTAGLWTDGVHTIQQAAVLAGVCGPGGFAASKTLGKGDHNDWGPQFGFAYDVFGNGKTALRGGFGVSYEGTLYNPLSNSRWNPPYYSFNQALDFATGTGCGTPTGCVVAFGPQSGGTPSYTGPADPANFQGTDTKYTAVGNIMGWNPNNPDQANLTGIVFPQGIRDPYVYNFHFGIQHEIAPHLVIEADYVGTAAHKLFRAQQVNRIPGGSLPAGTCITDRFGRNLCSQKSATNSTGRLNPNYGRLRVWENSNSSNYNALQLSVTRQMAHGIQATFHYTYSHAIDNGSTWHSGATSSNHEAAGEGYSLDQTMPGLDRGNSIYDMRHTLTFNYVWELPFFKSSSGLMRTMLGGWQFNGSGTYHTGAHWEPFCHGSRATCDYNNDFEANDRPDSSVAHFGSATHDMWANGWGGNWCYNAAGCVFQRPPAGNPGTLGRNTFSGPGFMAWNPSLVKVFRISEGVTLDFRAEAFNVLNHTNFKLPGAQGAFNSNVRSPVFGLAGGTFNPRNLQFGLKLKF